MEENEIDRLIRQVNADVARAERGLSEERLDQILALIKDNRRMIEIALNTGNAEDSRVALLVSDKIFELLQKSLDP